MAPSYCPSHDLHHRGCRIREYRGIARGIVVRSPTIARHPRGLENIVGGRIEAYTEMCEQARQQAFDLMIRHAWEMAPTRWWVSATTPPRCEQGSATEVSATGRRWSSSNCRGTEVAENAVVRGSF